MSTPSRRDVYPTSLFLVRPLGHNLGSLDVDSELSGLSNLMTRSLSGGGGLSSGQGSLWSVCSMVQRFYTRDLLSGPQLSVFQFSLDQALAAGVGGFFLRTVVRTVFIIRCSRVIAFEGFTKAERSHCEFLIFFGFLFFRAPPPGTFPEYDWDRSVRFFGLCIRAHSRKSEKRPGSMSVELRRR